MFARITLASSRSLSRIFAYRSLYYSLVPVIRLARELELCHILPIAFYELQIYYPMAAGLKREIRGAMEVFYDMDVAELDKHDLQTVTEGREDLLMASKRAIQQIEERASSMFQILKESPHKGCCTKLWGETPRSRVLLKFHTERNIIFWMRKYELALLGEGSLASLGLSDENCASRYSH